MTDDPRRIPLKGRGAIGNAVGRYEAEDRTLEDDGWGDYEQPPAARSTTVEPDAARSVISTNRSPDVPFEQSVNPYRGCEHGCVYCFARPTHAYLGLSPGLDFESRLFFKPDAPARLRGELARRGYTPKTLALGTNTDPYQPLERRLQITRGILEVLQACRHPVSIVTKGALIERDIDLLADMAARGLCEVSISIATLDHGLARLLEPRASAPRRRLQTVARLSAAKIPVTVLIAPVIPALNDAELEGIVEQVAAAGATSVGYSVLRLPLEIADLFKDWLAAHYPLKADHVLARIRDLRGGQLYRSAYGERMRGTGPIAELIGRRFDLARRRAGLTRRQVSLDVSQFRAPRDNDAQLDLF